MTSNDIQAYFRQLNIDQETRIRQAQEFAARLPELLKPEIPDYEFEIAYTTDKGVFAHYFNLQTGCNEPSLKVLLNANVIIIEVLEGDYYDDLNTSLLGSITRKLCDALDPTIIAYEIALGELYVSRLIDGPLTLFVWECEAVIFALAHDVDEARRTIIRKAEGKTAVEFVKRETAKDPVLATSEVTGRVVFIA